MKWLVIISGGPYTTLGDLIYMVKGDDIYEAYDNIWNYLKSGPDDLPSGFDDMFVRPDSLDNPPLEKSNFKVKAIEDDHLIFYEQYNGHGLPSTHIEIRKFPRMSRKGITKLAYIPD